AERPTEEQSRGLEGTSHTLLNGTMGRKAVKTLPAQFDRAAVRTVSTAQEAEQSGFARTVRAYEAANLSFSELDIHPVHGADAAERFARSFNLKELCHRRTERLAAAITASIALMKPPGITMITTTKMMPASSSPMPEDRFSRSGVPTMNALPSKGPSTRPAPPTLNATNMTKPT